MRGLKNPPKGYKEFIDCEMDKIALACNIPAKYLKPPVEQRSKRWRCPDCGQVPIDPGARVRCGIKLKGKI